MTKVRNKLDKLNTEFELQETLCSAIATWVEDNKVVINKYPQKHHNALITQENIRWSHIFTEDISQEWIKLYEESDCNNTQNNKQRHSYLWGASVMEVILS